MLACHLLPLAVLLQVAGPAAKAARPIDQPRPHLRWSQPGAHAGGYDGIRHDDRGRVFLFDHALVEATGPTFDAVDGFIATAGKGEPFRMLQRAAGADVFALSGDTLLAAPQVDGMLAGFDLAQVDPPSSAETPARVAAAVLAGPFAEARRSTLLEIPALGSVLVEHLRREDDPFIESALIYLARRPVPEALPLIIERLAGAKDPRLRRWLIEALAAQDAGQASEALRAAERSEAADESRRATERLVTVALHQQLWRTGRSSSVGLCPAGPPRQMPVSVGESIGTDHPMLFQRVAPDGRWAVMCQAREDTDHDGVIKVQFLHNGSAFGDALRPYLIVGAGPGVGTDAVLGSDPTGRYVATRNGACLELVDTIARTMVTLPDADLRAADRDLGPTRAVTFSADGSRMLYVRGGTPRPRLVLRTLADGKEIALDPGPGNLSRATLDPEGSWILLEFVADGDWPGAAASLSSRSCSGPLGWNGGFRPRGGEIRRKIMPALPDAKPGEVNGLVRGFGANLLVRTPEGALAEISAAGEPVRTLVPADCRGRVIHADGKRGLVLVVCTAEEAAPAPPTVFGKDRPIALKIALSVPEHDSWKPGRPRYLRLDDRLLDLDRIKLVDKAELAVHEARGTEPWIEGKAGNYAVRGDGARLRGPKIRPREAISRGPLRWDKAASGK